MTKLSTSTNAAGLDTAKPSKALHVALWFVQIVLGVAYVVFGLGKVTQPIAALAQQMGWPGAVPEPLVRFIGICEFLGGLGLILPAATRVKPGLTALAGAGLATLMMLATVFHLSRGEPGMLPVTLISGGLAALVAWGRWKKAPIAAR